MFAQQRGRMPQRREWFVGPWQGPVRGEQSTAVDSGTAGCLTGLLCGGAYRVAVGVALAQRLGVPFAVADDFHPPANIAKMAAGQPLDDDDRYPWLEAIGRWLFQRCDTGGVMSCSALKRKYRDHLRSHCTQTEF